jgi:hypothetical protein
VPLRGRRAATGPTCSYGDDVPLRGRRAATGMTCSYGADVQLRGRRAATGKTCRYGADVQLRGRRAATGPTCRYGEDVPLRGRRAATGKTSRYGEDVPLRGRLRRFDRRRRSDSGTGYGRGRQPGLFGLETRSTSTISESLPRAPFDPPDPPFEILDRRGSPKAGPESAEGRGLFVAPPSDVPLRG